MGGFGFVNQNGGEVYSGWSDHAIHRQTSSTTYKLSKIWCGFQFSAAVLGSQGGLSRTQKQLPNRDPHLPIATPVRRFGRRNSCARPPGRPPSVVERKRVHVPTTTVPRGEVGGVPASRRRSVRGLCCGPDGGHCGRQRVPKRRVPQIGGFHCG